MFIAKQKDLIVQVANTRKELEGKIALMPNVTIEETTETYELVEGKFITIAEKQVVEKERIQTLSMTPLDFIKALEAFAGITYAQVKELCDTYPEIDRELRFCQNVYRNNPMLSQESLAKLPEAFRLTEEQIDNLFVAVDNLKREERNILS